MKTQEKGTETLAYKQSILDGLVTTLNLNTRPLFPREKEQTEAIEYGVTTRLAALVERCKHEELDIKIAGIRETIAILKAHE